MCTDCCCCEKETTNKSLARKNVCCTDITFLLLFIAFWAGMLLWKSYYPCSFKSPRRGTLFTIVNGIPTTTVINDTVVVYMAVFAIRQGDAYRIVFGYDSFGNTCSEDNTAKAIANVSNSGMDVSGRKYVFFLDIFDPEESMEICVSACPEEELNTPKDVKDFYDQTGSRLCEYSIDPERYEDEDLYPKVGDPHGNGPCPRLPVFASTSIVYRCLPDPTKLNDSAALSKVLTFLNKDDNVFRKVLSDFYSSWKEMLYMCLVAVAIAFITVLLVRFLAAIIVWVTVILAAVSTIVGTAFLWWTYVEIRNDMKRSQEKFDLPLLDIDVNNEHAFLAFSITATVLTVLLLLVILIMRKRLSLVIALFGEAGKCVIAMPLLLFQPVWTFLVMIIFIVYWAVIVAYIVTCATPVASYEKSFNEVKYEPMRESEIFFWYYMVGFIWTIEFILAAQQFVIGSAVSMWYFTREKSITGCSCLVAKATSRLVLHHIGTVAFGSLIITMVKIPRYILMYLHSKFKDSENAVAKCCLKCCICCLWCLEKMLKYLHQNAYTITAIEGSSFCPAAKRAFGIIASNALRVAALNSVGDFVLFLGKVGVMASTCAIAVLWFRELDLHFYALPVLLVSVVAYFIGHCLITIYESIEGLHFYAIPVLLLSFVSYAIAHCFLSVYEMVVDCLLLCFCVDSELNDGSPGREFYMSTSLMGFVEKSSYDMDVIDGRIKPGSEHPTESQPLNASSPAAELEEVKPKVH